MDLKNLNTFIHTAELNSFTKAAEKLGYSQSTVSFQIKQLESELGIPLFERINHTIALTEKGTEILKYAHQMNQILHKMQETTEPVKDIRGHVRFAMADSLCAIIAHPLFDKLQQDYPGITIQIRTGGTQDLFRMLNQNEVDFVYTLDNHVYNTDYIIAKETKEGIHFVTNASNPLCNCDSISIQDLVHMPFILTEKGMSYRRMMDENLASRSLEIKPIFELGDTAVICRILENSSCISYLPDYAAKNAVDSGKLRYLNVQDFDVDIWAQLLYHRDKWVSPQMQAVIETLTKFSDRLL